MALRPNLGTKDTQKLQAASTAASKRVVGSRRQVDQTLSDPAERTLTQPIDGPPIPAAPNIPDTGNYSEIVKTILAATGGDYESLLAMAETPEERRAIRQRIREQEDFQNQRMVDSPEYQQMQEAIDTQKQLVADQKEQSDQIRSQYEQLQQDYQARDEELTGYLEGLGDTERKNLEKQRTQLKASQKEDLMRRGLTSSSALTSAMRGVDITANEGLSAMEERLRAQKLDYRTQFSGDTLRAKEQAQAMSAQLMSSNFASGQAVPSTMAELANMMSQQRMSREQNRSGTFAAALGAESQRFSSATSARASQYASLLGYKSDLAATSQRESASKRDAALGKYRTDVDAQLGYSGMLNQQSLARVQGDYQVQANKKLPGKSVWDQQPGRSGTGSLMYSP